MVAKNSLGDQTVNRIADFFKNFGDPTRIKILYTLLSNELSVGALCEELGMNQSAVSHQLRLLRQNGLIKYRKEGKLVFYSLDDDHVSTLLSSSLDHINHM